jgi:dihydrofolate synthase/folylpolyglutamate synthase
VLERLGHPQRRVPPVIHVAGTNGKGSTIAFLRAMLEAAGRNVHVYTSPNLVRVNERFRLGGPGGGLLVSDEELADALAECERANGDAPITLFEIETAAAFVLFARHPADVLLLEVGLGGRLDATNVIDNALASIVTPVSMDHLEFLGDTIEKIAAEKAGIFREGIPAVIAPQTAAASAVLERQAERIRALLHVAGQHWHANVENGRLVYQDEQGLLDLPPPKLYGRHQFDNAGTAIATLRAAGIRLPVKAMEQGLTRAEWPARLQRITSGKLMALAPAGAELWLDGGHNADGGRAVAAALGDLEERVSRPLVLVVGMLGNKDRDGFLRNFTGLVRRVFGVPLAQEKGTPAADIAGAALTAGMPADAAGSVEEALAAIRRLGFDPPPRILITGSLYLAGEVLAANGTEPV